MLSPFHRIGRETVRDLLFPQLPSARSANALSKALSLAREAVAPLGEVAPHLLQADRANIWVGSDVVLDIDAEAHENGLRSALTMAPGAERDNALSIALQRNGKLLDEEPYADWAIAPREALELLRQRARLELARDRTRGFGRSETDSVIDAWEGCLAHDPASEEAASALMRVYAATGQRHLASSTFERCRSAVETLGLTISPALEDAKQAIGELAVATHAPPQSSVVAPEAYHGKDERRLISVVFAQFSGMLTGREWQDPEEAKRTVGAALAGAIAEVEALGGTVMSVSGAGLAALFGAPITHEDDPERAVRAAFRMLVAIGEGRGIERSRLSLRIGIETGSAVVGPLWPATGASYGAAGPVVEAAAALQSAARPSSVLVGPGTKRATEGLFESGPALEVAVDARAKPLPATYLVGPRALRPGNWSHRGAVRSGRFVGRQSELAGLEEVLRKATSGTGSVVFIVGEPGLGKTRLVQECRKRFMGWVGARTGRLPALVGRPLCVVRIHDALRALPATALCLGRNCSRRTRASSPPSV